MGADKPTSSPQAVAYAHVVNLRISDLPGFKLALAGESEHGDAPSGPLPRPVEECDGGPVVNGQAAAWPHRSSRKRASRYRPSCRSCTPCATRLSHRRTLQLPMAAEDWAVFSAKKSERELPQGCMGTPSRCPCASAGGGGIRVSHMAMSPRLELAGTEMIGASRIASGSRPVPTS